MIPYRTASTDGYVKRNEFLNPVTITDISGGGAIGTAAATVDIASVIFINQTTASQTLTLPTPTATAAGTLVVVANVGSQAFTMLGTSITTSGGIMAIYTGSTWQKVTL